MTIIIEPPVTKASVPFVTGATPAALAAYDFASAGSASKAHALSGWSKVLRIATRWVLVDRGLLVVPTGGAHTRHS
jgi:hypothetical protein